MDPDSGRVNVVIDTPQGSRNKYKFDEQHGQWRLSKVLPQGMCFPYNFGFIPSTRGEDGDPLDVLLFADEPSFPGCVVPARLIGVLEAEQSEGGKTIRNDRLVAVVETPYNPVEYHSLDEVNRQRLDEIEHFFVSYNKMEGRQFKPLARHGPDRGLELVEQATHRRHRTQWRQAVSRPGQEVTEPAVRLGWNRAPMHPESHHVISTAARGVPSQEPAADRAETDGRRPGGANRGAQGPA